MGIIKNKTVKGYVGSYWRIIQINCNFDRNDAVVTFGLYKDKETRNSDPSAVIDSYSIDLGEMLNLSGNDTVKNINISKAYITLKEKALEESQKEEKDDSLAFFADAVDSI